jgi:hypothetical protein
VFADDSDWESADWLSHLRYRKVVFMEEKDRLPEWRRIGHVLGWIASKDYFSSFRDLSAPPAGLNVLTSTTVAVAL